MPALVPRLFIKEKAYDPSSIGDTGTLQDQDKENISAQRKDHKIDMN